MKLEMTPRVQLQLKMKLAPQIIQSIEILQLPLLALLEHVQTEMEENPVLEEETVLDAEVEDNPPDGEETEAAEEERVDVLPEEWQSYSRPRSRSARRDERDKKQEALENTSAKPISFHEYLFGQLSLMDMTGFMRDLCEHIICNMDDNGYLSTPLDEIVNELEQPVAVEDAGKALRMVQSMEPLGVGARNLEECLLLQMDKKYEEYELAEELILHYLKDIEMKRYPQVAKKTGRSLETIKKVVEHIGSLNPKPGSVFCCEPIAYVVPDVKVEYVDGRYEVTLNEDYALPYLSINSTYRTYLNQRNSDNKTKEYIKKKIESARWLIDAIEQRRATLYKVATNLVELQQDFFEEGVSSLKPLKMQELADRLGIHVSTVSRALARKYIQTPRGIFEMKYFFTGGFSSGDGDTESWEATRQRLREIIDKEDKKHPLSDEEIVAALKAKGVDVARRTVTKYRKLMKFPSSRQRRQY
ncbi:MAG: RNA polymerase factor sigma-54 [Candidatus Brocadiales bacterium]|nr:RNA polymerase factor sigma-54 [Candidatus Bathyanammoxibius amoris]